MKINSFLVLLALLVSIRFINISMPILEGTATRQVQTAEIARNYFRDGIDLLYPKTGFFGPGPGYLVLEFPLLNALSAVLSRAIGSFQEWTGRVFTILFFAGAALFLFGIIRRIFDEETAFWAVAAFGLLPLSVIFSRAFMPDFEMIFFCLGALYFALTHSTAPMPRPSGRGQKAPLRVNPEPLDELGANTDPVEVEQAPAFGSTSSPSLEWIRLRSPFALSLSKGEPSRAKSRDRPGSVEGLLYHDAGRVSCFWASAFFLSIALLIKPHSFYIGVPIAYLMWKRRGWRSVSDIGNWIYAGIAVVPALLWFRHAAIVHRLYNPEMAWTYEVATWLEPRWFSDPRLIVTLIKIYGGIFLTPVGLALFAAGLFIRTEGKENIVWAWLGGSILFLLACHRRIDDPYYNLNMLPIISVFIARAVVFLKKPGTRSMLLGNRQGKIFVIALFAVFWARYSLYAYIIPKGYRHIPEAGRCVQALAGKDDLVVASSAGGWHALYYCDRKGWILRLPGEGKAGNEEAIAKLESFRGKGAAYYVTPVLNEFDSSPGFKDHMMKNYTVVERKDGRYAIFALRR